MKIKFFKYLLLTSLLLFMFSIFCLIPISVNANTFRGSNNYYYELEIKNESYYMRVRDDINFNDIMIEYNGRNVFNDELYIFIDNNFYDALRIDITNGSIFASFYNTDTDEEFILVNIGIENYIYKNSIPLYHNVLYYITLQPSMNAIFSFENKIGGYYTFNSNIIELDFYSYNFVEPTQEFKITGSLVYPVDNYYLFYGFESPLNNEIFSILMYSPNGDSYYYELENFFDNDTDFLRYMYFDNQFIDTLLYEFLISNGSFRYAMPQSYYNVTFWDLINAYVNIPVQIISNVLDISLFNTGITLLVVFGTMLIIVLAIKVGRMITF